MHLHISDTHTHSQLQLHRIPNSAVCHRGFISQARCVFLKARTVVYAIPCGDESNCRFALQIRLRIYFCFRIQMSFLREVRLAVVTCVATCSGAAPKHFATVACAERLIVDSFVDAGTFGRIKCMCVCVVGYVHFWMGGHVVKSGVKVHGQVLAVELFAKLCMANVHMGKGNAYFPFPICICNNYNRLCIINTSISTFLLPVDKWKLIAVDEMLEYICTRFVDFFSFLF